MDKEIKNAVIDVLKSIKPYISGNRNEKCYLTAYQIAVLLLEDKKNKKYLIDKEYLTNIGGAGGGAGEGKYNSLSQRIATDLAKEPDTFDIAFLNTKGIHQFSFIDEKGILSEPSVESFSMFRLKND